MAYSKEKGATGVVSDANCGAGCGGGGVATGTVATAAGACWAGCITAHKKKRVQVTATVYSKGIEGDEKAGLFYNGNVTRISINTFRTNRDFKTQMTDLAWAHSMTRLAFLMPRTTSDPRSQKRS